MGRMLQGWLLVGLGMASVGCRSAELREEFIVPMEAAHGKEAWLAHDALHMEIHLSFGEKPALEATFVFETKGPKVRMDVKDGPTVVYDGAEAWITPASAEMDRARFHVLTWPWFVVTPYKMSDKGVHMRSLGALPMEGREQPAAMMTFAGGMGDTPDDWYILYMDPELKLLTAMSYIVTYGKDPKEANKEPHAITYHDFKVIGGASFSTRWEFRHWSKEKGVHGEPLGEAKLSNIWFTTPKAGTFDKPADARVLPLPKS